MNDFEKCKRYGNYYVDQHGHVHNSELNRYCGRIVYDYADYRYLDSGVYLLTLSSLGAIVHWLKILNGEVKCALFTYT